MPTMPTLIPGSLTVKKGDRVRRGQVLGLVGNSGNSDFAHLHFHISDRPFPLAGTKQLFALNANGIPWEFNRFIREDYLSFGEFEGIDIVPNSIVPLEKKTVTSQIFMNDEFGKFY